MALGDRLLGAAEERLMIERNMDEHDLELHRLHDLIEMQLHESRKIQGEMSYVKMHVKFLQHGVAMPDEDDGALGLTELAGGKKNILVDLKQQSVPIGDEGSLRRRRAGSGI
jgi:hypothetical protein